MKKHRQHFIGDPLILRATVIEGIRQFFVERDYLEIETPVRIPAPAPEAHIDAEPSEGWFLQTSPELCMKRMLSAGYPKIYQIAKVFRQRERGRRHLPEFTLLEWYTTGDCYLAMMNQTELLVRHVARTLGQGDSITYRGSTIDLSREWPRISVEDAFRKFASTSMHSALRQDRFDEIMDSDIEPALPGDKPVFLYDYPAARGALARLKPDNSAFAERFELYIGGLELCNGFTELTDPAEQRNRFEKESEERRTSGKILYPLPERFLEALGGMPDAAGNALGVDRLVMLFADAAAIDGVVAFTPEAL